MIVDTHVHIWEMPPIAPIGPTAPNFTSLPDEPGTAEELLADMDANGVDYTVLVQTSWSTWDNGYVADSAKKYPNRFVAHGLVDPLAPDNAEIARYWVEERGMVGFRFHPEYYDDIEILTRPEDAAMWKTISEIGAIVQVHNRPRNAHQLDAVAAKYPNITWLIDHLMYPEVAWAPKYEAYQPVLALARHPNVYMKISDVHSRSKQGFPYQDMHPVIKKVIDAFGIERCLWGTGYPGHHRQRHNWPSLADELRLIREGLPFLSQSDKDRILGENAARIWRLPRPLS
ncbi:MAG: amidohydrolase [Chloroflexi bacterium]|nr:amidohydrolase [Chloroflexota bacterium]